MSVRPIACIVTAALIAACGAGASGTSPSTAAGTVASATAAGTGAPPSASRPSPTLADGVSLVVPLEGSTYGIAAAGSTIWVENGSEIVQLDAVTGERRRSLPGSVPTVEGSSLWYIRDVGLVQADPGTGDERATFTPPRLGTTVVDGVLWAASEEDKVLDAIDLRSGKILHTTKLPDGEPKAVRVWEGAVWVVVDGMQSGVVRIDPASGDLLTFTKMIGKRPHSVGLGFGSLWVTDHGSPNLYRFAPDGTLQATVVGPGWNVAIAATDEAIWAAASRSLMRVDPATNLVTNEIEVGIGDWYGLAYAAGNLWLTSGEGSRILQIPVPAP